MHNTALQEILKQTKALQAKTQVVIDSGKALYNDGEGGLLSKEMLLEFPMQEGELNWMNSYELGSNVLGIRVPSEDSIKFVLRAIYEGVYDTHYHDLKERVTVDNEEGEVKFLLEDGTEKIANIHHRVEVEKDIKHSVVVKKGTLFTVDFLLD